MQNKVIFPSASPQENNASGLLLIDKPCGFTSNDIVALARRALRTKCIGHSGTLDPMATGLLILLVQRKATRLQSQFLKLDKIYQATLQLGIDTDTWDAEGKIVQNLPVPPLTLSQIKTAADTLTGTIQQQIPPFSAKKINGRKMYDLARQGLPLEQRFNSVKIFSWKEISFDGHNRICFTLHCSCGTYVRSVARALALALGTTGHLTALRRLSIGHFSVQNAFDGYKLKNTPLTEIVQWLQEPVI